MTDNKLQLDPKTSALLVMDFQTAIVAMIPTVTEALLARTAGLIDAARNAEMKVIYVVVGFRADYPEASPRNKNLSFVVGSGQFVEGAAGSKVHTAVAPKPGDVVVTRHRRSAFTGTDLDLILRSNGIETLVLAGIATSGVVLSTVGHAADADYRLVVVTDCCSDGDAEVHRILTEKIFVKQTTSLTAEAVIAALAPANFRTDRGK
jgi:nicotinamidase-related amidase